MISPRKRRPAYANALIEARRAGRHPSSVVVVYGFPWQVGDGVCCLGVKPGEALDIDWACVAGVDVEVWNRSRVSFWDVFEKGDGEILRLCADIACQAIDVRLADAGPSRSIAELAFLGRGLDEITRKMVWPAWWSEERQKIHEQNKLRRERAIIAWLDAKCAA